MVIVFGPAGIMVNELGPFPGHFDQHRSIIDMGTFDQPTKPDPGWTHTDSSGHFHAYNVNSNHALFTMEERFRTESEWSTYDGGIEEWKISIGWYCVLCGEKIPSPQRIPDMNPVTYGLTTWNVEFEQISNPKLWGLLQSPHKVSIRIPSINGFGIGTTEFRGLSNEGYDFIVRGEGEFGRHG